jgi:hypothetical protein
MPSPHSALLTFFLVLLVVMRDGGHEHVRVVDIYK